MYHEDENAKPVAMVQAAQKSCAAQRQLDDLLVEDGSLEIVSRLHARHTHVSEPIPAVSCD